MKIISWDLWGTLIKGNKDFSSAKVQLIRQFANSYIPEQEINLIQKSIKMEHDLIMETYGTQPDHMHLFAEMCLKLDIPSKHLVDFESWYQKAFLKNLPTLYSKDTLNVLDMIHTEYDFVGTISSNTLSIRPSTMQTMVEVLGIGKYIKTVRYSGNMKCSKPDIRMFNTLSKYHVGDNPVTDGACINAGVEFYQINTNDKTIVDFYNHVLKNEKIFVA